MHKRKRTVGELKPTILFFFLLGLFCLFIVTAQRASITIPQFAPIHCITETQSTQQDAEVLGYKCFDNQADSICYVTGGQLCLPPETTSQELSHALREFYEGQMH